MGWNTPRVTAPPSSCQRFVILAVGSRYLGRARSSRYSQDSLAAVLRSNRNVGCVFLSDTKYSWQFCIEESYRASADDSCNLYLRGVPTCRCSIELAVGSSCPLRFSVQTIGVRVLQCDRRWSRITIGSSDRGVAFSVGQGGINCLRFASAQPRVA